MKHIEECRTAALGGHVDECDRCGHVKISYNSCRDRHCPKCQSLKKAEWLDRRLERLLPVPYSHVVFTIPDELNPVVFRNKQVLYNILFRAASETLLTIASDRKHLGAQIGFTAILHTWGQNLLFHPHLHCVATAGGLAPSGKRWLRARGNFFLPVRVLGQLFRGKFLDYLSEARRQGRLSFEGSTDALAGANAFRRFVDALYRKGWVVYAKPPFGGVEHVFHYLGRYTHRVAISNGRLVEMKDGKVSFTVKDYADESRQKLLTLQAEEFIRRFLLHVLPKRFIRIRHFGLMAGRNVTEKLPRCRQLLAPRAPEPPPSTGQDPKPKKTWQERVLELTGVDPMECPRCSIGTMVRQAALAPVRGLVPAASGIDSS